MTDTSRWESPARPAAAPGPRRTKILVALIATAATLVVAAAVVGYALIGRTTPQDQPTTASAASALPSSGAAITGPQSACERLHVLVGAGRLDDFAELQKIGDFASADSRLGFKALLLHDSAADAITARGTDQAGKIAASTKELAGDLDKACVSVGY